MIDQFNNTLFIGKVAIHLKTVDSTNNYLKQLTAKSLPIEGTVILADKQTAGRGQIGSSWQSEAKQNITLSLLLRPKFLLAEQQFLLNAAISLGIYDFLNQFEFKSPLKIKWPNDIYIGEKKIAGVLIENQIKGKYLDWSVVGIGININQNFFASSIPNPTSLFLETNKKFKISDLLFQLYGTVERHYLRTRAGKFKEIRRDYTNQLFQLNKLASYSISKLNGENNVEDGTIEGIDCYGRVVIRFQDRIQAFDLKEISPILRKDV